LQVKLKVAIPLLTMKKTHRCSGILGVGCPGFSRFTGGRHTQGGLAGSPWLGLIP
jgi:hypothetical protein